MIHVWLKNGNFEILRDANELKDLIESEMGEDVASEIQKLIEAADYTQQKVQTDLTAYESQLDSFNSMCFEAIDVIKNLVNNIEDSKRLNRSEILKQIHGIQTLIENEI